MLKNKKIDPYVFIAPVGLIGLFIVFALTSPYFVSPKNLLNVLRQSSINITVAMGLTVVIITGGIDLSVGAICALCACFMAQLYQVLGVNIWFAAALSILIGLICGVISGSLISYGNLPPFIATLGIQGVARGLALLITKGVPSEGFPESFARIGKGSIAGIPIIFIIAIIVSLVIYILLKYTQFGRNLYAVGGGEEAAVYSGVNVRRVKIIAYTISGLCAAIAAIILAARVNSAPPGAGEGYELDAIAATVIGGASLSGGEGGVLGTLLGAFVMAVLANGLNLLDVNSFIQTSIIGLVIIVTVLIKSVNFKKST